MSLATKTAPSQNQEVRGFGLYVGINTETLAQAGVSLERIVQTLQHSLHLIAPDAESHVTVALAPKQLERNTLELTRLALNEPQITRETQQQARPVRTKEDLPPSILTIDLARKEILLDSIPQHLSYREFELLRFFVLREGLTITRAEIIDTLYPNEQLNDRTIDVYIRRLRNRLGKYQRIIRTVHGQGYRFDRRSDVKVVQGQTPSFDRF